MLKNTSIKFLIFVLLSAMCLQQGSAWWYVSWVSVPMSHRARVQNQGVYASCSALLAAEPSTSSGVHQIDPDGAGGNAAFDAYCDMTTDGGGWTMVVAQYEADPVTDWNEGIQGDYDPSLATTKGFALNTAQLPSHNQIAFGENLNPTAIDYVNGTYTTGNIAVTNVWSPKTETNYHIHRDTAAYFNSHDPENVSGVLSEWYDTLTFDKTGGQLNTWAFSPENPTIGYRGYAMDGYQGGADTSAWTVWVRDYVEVYSSCSDILAQGFSTGDGVYEIDPDGAGGNAAFDVYCDMTTDGGGWTMVVAQFEADPVTNWNEGIQGDYDPTLATSKGFALNTAQLPTHDQIAFGKGTDPTTIDYAAGTYSTGDIAVTSLTGINSGNTYEIHRDVSNYYLGFNPEGTLDTSNPEAMNSLTFDQTGGELYTWSFAPNFALEVRRGFGMENTLIWTTTESYPWTVWVRDSSDLPVYTSCSDILNHGASTGDGVYEIDPDGEGTGNDPFDVYCDMTTDGGGWTMVVAQFEADPVTNWNEGIQGDYDPSLATSKGFALNTAQLPSHNQMAIGKALDPTFVDYMDGTYGTGNIALTAMLSPKTGNTYQMHRSTASYYNAHDPESTVGPTPDWYNTLTVDKTDGGWKSWAFSPGNPTADNRGYALDGYHPGSDAYGWTVWVRQKTETPVTYYASCKAILDDGASTGDGIYTIDPDGVSVSSTNPYEANCNMTTDGGGWTMVLAQYESDPVPNWNEGIQTDYDPTLVAGTGFALDTEQIPSHTQMAFGKDEDPTGIDYVNGTYTTGNIAKTLLTGLGTANTYHIHRSATDYYGAHDPEGSIGSDNPLWDNTLTFNEADGGFHTWAFSPNQSTVVSRGFAYGGVAMNGTSESFAWTTWVR